MVAASHAAFLDRPAGNSRWREISSVDLSLAERLRRGEKRERGEDRRGQRLSTDVRGDAHFVAKLTTGRERRHFGRRNFHARQTPPAPR